MPLELDQLRRSLEALSALLAVSENQTRMEELSEVERDGLRSGAIQKFEITYELAWKLIARWLNNNITAGIATGVPRKELFRLAAQHGLLADIDAWMQHHEARNATAHLYDEEKAAFVYHRVTHFAHDARRLLAELDARND
jgi:nucleotidyltransferase substrate binding protein (TIGR01987 family)